MKKITTNEERMQLHNNGIYLEGYFNALSSLKAGQSVYLIFVLLVCVFFLCIPNNKVCAIIFFVALMLFLFLYPLVLIYDFRQFKKKQLTQCLKEENIEINWATIVQIDKENRQISFLEDDVKSPEGKPYIVDYIATERDCECVAKGERIILVHVWDKTGKEIVLPMIPKREFTLLREKEKCEAVHVAGVAHVPHVNAFLRKENEVLFHSRFSENNWTIDFKKFGRNSRYGNRMPKAIVVYEWNGEAYELKLYWIGRVRHWSYGDILQKKEKRFIIGNPEYYFVSK